jgi:protein SCO1/2
VLREYLAYFHPDIIGLTGTPELVQRASANFNVTYAKVSDPGRDPGLYAMDHSAGIFLMAPDGAFVAKFAHTLEAEALAARLGPILHGD